MAKAWQIWADKPEKEGTLVKRAKGELPQMESTKQLVRLIRPLYKPGMRILDVGCNTGHYLRGMLELDENVTYKGVDAYPFYINQAKKIYQDLPNVSFEVKDVFKPLFPRTPYDITYCCNVILHLPDFRVPLRNILASTKKVSFVRTLIGPSSTIVKRVEGESFDGKGEPKQFTYQNTYTESMVSGFASSLGWKAEFIDDEFNPNVLAKEHVKLKSSTGTRVIAGRQVDGNILFDWRFIRFTRKK